MKDPPPPHTHITHHTHIPPTGMVVPSVLGGCALTGAVAVHWRRWLLSAPVFAHRRRRVRATLNGSVPFHTFVYPLDRAYDRVREAVGETAILLTLPLHAD